MPRTAIYALRTQAKTIQLRRLGIQGKERYRRENLKHYSPTQQAGNIKGELGSLVEKIQRWSTSKRDRSRRTAKQTLLFRCAPPQDNADSQSEDHPKTTNRKGRDPEGSKTIYLPVNFPLAGRVGRNPRPSKPVLKLVFLDRNDPMVEHTTTHLPTQRRYGKDTQQPKPATHTTSSEAQDIYRTLNLRHRTIPHISILRTYTSASP